jgi:hypothetical protein
VTLLQTILRLRAGTGFDSTAIFSLVVVVPLGRVHPQRPYSG